GGPLGVSSPIGANLMSKTFSQACQQAGLPYNPDFNGATQAGCGLYQTTTRNARRCSAAVGYLKDARQRSNLTIKTG
ncbi:GMC family oxidoreductase N-terminal domain-containing protein, partial [Klebsiella pneumoniae]|nr:GMC family oxidoreductase N-terminal domain-containing protein [Klebsiella pneumoniae]